MTVYLLEFLNDPESLCAKKGTEELIHLSYFARRTLILPTQSFFKGPCRLGRGWSTTYDGFLKEMYSPVRKTTQVSLPTKKKKNYFITDNIKFGFLIYDRKGGV